ncbi:MAG: protein kinase [Gemmatimonadaceae bacterium]
MVDLPHSIESALGDNYRLERELPGGGMSRLFLATDRSLNRLVVIKVLPPELTSEVSASRFKQEIEFAAQLHHPHILSLLATGTFEGLLYYIMPYVSGESLRERLLRDKRLSVRDAWFILRETAGALAYAHARGIIHRDIKPENILLQEGHALLADFGASRALNASLGKGRRHTETGFTIGTPGYMAPEQLAGDRDIDHRADIYALALVGFEMLAGNTPAGGRGGDSIVAMFTEDATPLIQVRPDVPPAMSDVIGRGLARDPRNRYQSASELSLALEAVFAHRMNATVGWRRLYARILGDSAVPMSPALRRGPRHKSRTAIYGAAILIVAAIGYGVLASGIGYKQSGFLGSLAPASGDSTHAIAVLPFANTSPDAQNEYISDGITEELIDALSGIEKLRVASRTSAFAFKGRNVDVRDIGRQLDVSSILEGSVRRSGNRLKVTAQLVDVRNGYELWTGSFEREMDDVFVIQNEIATSIVNKLRGRLAAQGDWPIIEPSTQSAEAYNLYLQGRFHWNKRTVAGVRKAADFFQQALAVDSNFALAYSGLADSYSLLGSFEYAALPAAEAFPKAKQAALRALKLDDELAEAHASLASAMRNYDWDWTGAEKEFRRALELDSEYVTALQWYAGHLVGIGRTNEGIAQIDRAQALEPTSVNIGATRGRLLYFARRYDEAIEEFKRTLDLDSTFVVARVGLALAYEQKGMSDSAVAELQRASELSGRSHVIVYPLLGYIYGRSGKRAEARKVLAELEAQSRQRYMPPEFLAIVRLGLGDTRTAMDLMEEAYEGRSGALVYLKVEPLLDPLRAYPRFVALVQRMRL